MAERLQKYLASAGVASRRAAEELITAGRVMVNNRKVTELGSRVEPGDLVTVDGSLVAPPEEKAYFLLYKPTGVVTTLDDPQGRPTVAHYVAPLGRRLFPVGRLDYDAEGALLFTDDGELTNRLTHPRFEVPRTYLAKVKGTPDEPTLEKLRGGVRLEDGMATPLEVEVRERAERNTWMKLVVAEGRPHLIKRLCAAVGHPVVRLFRPSYAGIGVAGLKPGEVRPLSESEVDLLRAVSEGSAEAPTADLTLPPRRHGRGAPGIPGEEGEEMEEAPRPAPRATGVRPRGEGTRARPSRGATERPARGFGAKPSARGEALERRPRRGEEAGARPQKRAFGARGPLRGEEAGGKRPSRGFAPRGPMRGEEAGERRPARAFGARGPMRGEEAGERRPARAFGARGPMRGEEAGGKRPSRGFAPRGPMRGEEAGGRRPTRAPGAFGPARSGERGGFKARPSVARGPARGEGAGPRPARAFGGRGSARGEERGGGAPRTFGGRPSAGGPRAGARPARTFGARPSAAGEASGARPERRAFGTRPPPRGGEGERRPPRAFGERTGGARGGGGGRFGIPRGAAGEGAKRRSFGERPGRPAGRGPGDARAGGRGGEFSPRGPRALGAKGGRPSSYASPGTRTPRTEGARTDWRAKKLETREPRWESGRPRGGPRKGPPKRR
ncbi:MAG: pseudouridine synthase [Myxococcaceae bacterium]|nr:pseudouridine synthase [Myxococcaceae bacterium]